MLLKQRPADMANLHALPLPYPRIARTTKCPLPPPTGAAAALNQLELLELSDAWLDAAHPLLADAAPGSAVAADGDPNNSTLQMADGGGGEDGGGEDGGGEGDDSSSLFAARRARLRKAASPGVVALPALRREVALFSAASRLVDFLPGLDVLRAPAPGEDFVFDQLLAAGRLGEAEALAHVLWRGGELEEHLERLAAAAAARCVRAQAGGGGGSGGDGGSGDGGSGEGPAGADDGLWDDGGSAWAATGGAGAAGGAPAYLGCPAAAGWQRLRRLLARYGAAGRRRLGGRLRVAAVDAALSEVPGAALPTWLVAPFAPGGGVGAGGMAGGPDDPAALLRVYIRHGRLADAANLALAHLAAWQAANPLARCKPAAVWLPLRQLEALDACLADAAAAPAAGAGERLAGLKARLRAAVAEHLALGARDSKLAAAGGPSGGGGGGPADIALG
jgi:hypothetical protein